MSLSTEPLPKYRRVIELLRQELAHDSVFDRVEERLVYEYDYGLDRSPPDLVVTPRSAAEAAAVVRLAAAEGIAVVPRGAGPVSPGALYR